VAPSSGLHVLTSSNNAAAIVGGFVDIQPGKSYGSFPITTTSVAVNTSATITAAYNGVNVTGILKITGLGINNFVINPNSVAGGTQTTGVVTLTLPAPAGGVDILLSTTPPGVSYPVVIPASIHINAGVSQAAFAIGTVPTGVTTLVPIKATLGASSKSASLQVLASGVSSITITPTVMHVNTSTTAGYVFLSGTAPPAGAIVTLTIQGGGSTIPAGSVKVPAGQSRGQFTFIAPSVVPVGGYVFVTATYPAGVSKVAKVQIIP
jgi:hypothetical protein